ncbi:MAG: RNA polymerase sporulation sigma factor SigE [Clostridiales bacterium]|nr:RNA polymerase sporulation sigma factor SigE [Clostridiales bacterium]
MKFLSMLKSFLKINFINEKIVCYISGAEVLPQPLSPQEEQEILLLHKQGDINAKNTLIERNLRLVVYISKKFDNTGIDVEDLISIGTIGLIKAVNSFDVDKKIKLATYASRCIENEILMHLRKVVRRKNEVSLDEPLNVDSDGNELLLSDVLGTETDMVYNDVEENVEKELLKNAIKKLSAREQQIVSLRFGLNGHDEVTQKEVADLLGISQSYISRLEKKIVNRLKKEIAKMV